MGDTDITDEEYDTQRYFLYCLMKKDYKGSLGESIGTWRYSGWISYKSLFELLVSNSLTSDHGEQRIVVPREDGRGVNCFWKER